MASTRARPSAGTPIGIVVAAIRGDIDAAFWPIGFSLLLFVLSTRSPIGEWSEQNLSMHMLVQHTLNLIPGLILGRLAAPLVTSCRPAVVSATNTLSVITATAVLVFWHLPVAFEAAVRDEGVHALMHLSFFSLVGLPLGLSLSNLGGSGRLLLFAAFVPVSTLGTVIPYSAPDLYPSYAPWQHVQMAWLMMVVMPIAGIALLVINAYWRSLVSLWVRKHLYEYGTAGMALLLLVMLITEIAGLGHSGMLD